jgi:WD40 repeat protein/DNA-binding winged helix-turn-helix (wHTH) protein
MAKVIPFRPKRAPPGAADSRDVARRPARRYNADTMPAQIETALDAAEPFLVGDWLVEPRPNRLTRGDASVQLELKAMDVLLCLAARAGEVVSKHELLDAVWQTEFVSDNTLQRRITDLREAFGDDAHHPRYIETIRKRGYRLIANVNVADASTEAAASLPEAPPTEAEDLNPYPGLAPFTEADADVFFGRESEVAALWRKISSRRLLAVIGPSGIGKTSLLRAGVVPAAPAGWRALVLTPGEAPSLALARALAPDLAGDPGALAQLVGFSDPDAALAVVARWRGLWREAVLIVDQFEELFTLNPPEVQESFVALLRRVVDVADVHVVLAMRDDFLIQCHRFPKIAPVFKDLTPLGQPSSAALRRALTEPAARRLVRFESETLVDEMIADVEAERGALPLLAFAVHRLWEERERERRLLTREAYLRIGGVAGALARHAETTLDRIGGEHLPLVRELFRNLVTSDGTRAVRETDELLSLFDEGEREAATRVLGELIDGRLLTTYELVDRTEKPSRRVEIIHESLLAAWPRLVRWQTQDADAAQLRDQLRRAARNWQERGRSDDLLWTGDAFREFALWRDRYPGRLTDTEEAYATAMSELAGRRRRRRRMAVGSIVAVLVIGLAATGTLWQRSVRAARAAEAQKLNALGRLELDSYPSAALAHAIASLELADNREARLLALEALWKGPTAFLVSPEGWTQWGEFSRDGNWIVQAVRGPPARLRLIHADGSAEELAAPHGESQGLAIGVDPGGSHFWSWDLTPEPVPRTFALWSAPAGRLLAEARYGASSWIVRSTWSGRRALLEVIEGGRAHIDAVGVDGSRERLGTLGFALPSPQLWFLHTAIDSRAGRWFGAVVNNEVVVLEIGEHELSEPRRLGHHEGPIAHVLFDPFGRFLATAGAAGEIRLWDPAGEAPPTVIQGPAGVVGVDVAPDGSALSAVARDPTGIVCWIWSLAENEPRLVRRLDLGREVIGLGGVGHVTGDPVGLRVARAGPDSTILLWTLEAPPAAEPFDLRTGVMLYFHRSLSFHPQGRWLAATSEKGLTLWPLARRYPATIQAHDEEVWQIAFAPDGQWLASTSLDGTARLWPLAGDSSDRVRILFDEPDLKLRNLAVSPKGDRLLVSTWHGVRVLSLDGEPPRTLQGFRGPVGPVAFSADGRLAAGIRASGVHRLEVWDVVSGRELQVIDPVESKNMDASIEFTPDGRLLAAGIDGLRQWNLETGDSALMVEGVTFFRPSADKRKLVLGGYSESRFVHRAAILDLTTNAVTPLDRHGDRIVSLALDATGDVVATASDDGTVRVGPATGEEPHLIPGQKMVVSLVVDPRGRWVAGAVDRTTICLWPMPDLSRPPLHTLPRGELLAKLKSLTNLRLVRDEESTTGWTLTHEAFGGWETVPSW